MENKILIDKHIAELKQKYSSFTNKTVNGSDVVEGLLPFTATYNNITIIDEYKIEIIIPNDYPKTPPLTKETGGRIPDNFHRNKDTENSLCLGSPCAVVNKLKGNPTLLHFVEQQVIPFLFSYSYYQKHKEMPYGELSHGGEGILEYYTSYFGLTDDIKIIGLLRILADNDYRGHILCPCGSQKKLRNCHGVILLELINITESNVFLYEYNQVIKHLIDTKKKIPKDFFSKKLIKEIKNNKNAKK